MEKCRLTTWMKLVANKYDQRSSGKFLSFNYPGNTIEPKRILENTIFSKNRLRIHRGSGNESFLLPVSNFMTWFLSVACIKPIRRQ